MEVSFKAMKKIARRISLYCWGSVEELDKIDRKREVGENNDDGDITLLNHVLWSCPWMGGGLSESNYKGLLWGADCTEIF
ncbi:unnamed protein product [Eruca vesicaria subsp. sativa]|uniref:Uncharacterized protein n=1 Tax=Eruca vesicaria subsp. sativa TaxID=29727 RepID=A0ABC8LWP7_ERUVS|nr:unnamed protein product [Eruca vesicaria subsp. sativa]